MKVRACVDVVSVMWSQVFMIVLSVVLVLIQRVVCFRLLLMDVGILIICSGILVWFSFCVSRCVFVSDSLFLIMMIFRIL